MKITFLGTGTSQGIPVIACSCPVCKSTNPKDKRLRCSLKIDYKDKCFVIDVGPDFRQQMLRSQTPKVDALLITHEHRDHIGGLDEVRSYNFRHKMDMPVYAELRTIQNIRQSFSYMFDNDYPGLPRVQLEVISPLIPFYTNGVSFTPLRVLHGQLPIIGYRIDNFAYLTDVRTLPDETIQALVGVDTLVISALHHKSHHSHNTLPEALEWIEKINPKQSYLIHMSHDMGFHDEVQQQLPDNVYLAYDGLQVTF
jgi:phosphoribosyl 1,2-cyclic phosphate phosphodiesterase